MGVALLNRGAIVVFVGGSSSLSRWFRKRKGAFPRILFSDQRNESRRTPEKKLIRRIAERQRHGCRGCADHGFAAAFRTRARDPGAPAQGHAPVLPMREEAPRV